MNSKALSIFTFSFLLLFSCNKKQEPQSVEALPAPVENIENDSITDQEVSRKESINLFNIMPKDSSDVAFISLSDIYPLNETDAEALPNIEERGILAAEYMTLESKQRKRFLSKINISENDSLFAYDYGKNKLARFAIKNLKASALLNGYSSQEDWPYKPYDYMVGFSINKQLLNGFSEYYRDAIVYVGKENPFSKEGLTPIAWKKTTTAEFPSKALKNEDQKLLKNTTLGSTYFYKNNSFHYFIQDYLDSRKEVFARRLFILNAKTKDIILEKLYSQSEGTSPSPLNYQNPDNIIEQYTGKLFKDKPPVVFGFLYESFGCPVISLIDKSKEEIYIQCDNRH
jgi:hypothetical protein